LHFACAKGCAAWRWSHHVDIRDDILQAQQLIGDAGRHRWRHAQRLMDAAEIEKAKLQRQHMNGRFFPRGPSGISRFHRCSAAAMIAEAFAVFPLITDAIHLPGLAQLAARALSPCSPSLMMHYRLHAFC